MVGPRSRDGTRGGRPDPSLRFRAAGTFPTLGQSLPRWQGSDNGRAPCSSGGTSEQSSPETWEEPLGRGDVETAWELFIRRYRRLILATIRRTIDAPEDVPDVFGDVCGTLSADGLAPLKRYQERADSRGRFSTWLVVIVRNRTIDWMRRQSGRRRVSVPESLSPLQREIFRHVFLDRRSHAETFELLAGGPAAGMSFRAFLRELAETYRRIERGRGGGVLRYLRSPPTHEPQPPLPAEELVLAEEAGARLAEVLETLSEDVQLAIHLFVVDGLPAADVAQTVGWRNAKEVYNRVYRGLAKLRAALEEQGIRPGDL